MPGPGRSHRQGISLLELSEMFPTEESAKTWFEAQRWPDGVRCPRCDTANASPVPKAHPAPWHCRPCRQYFSVRTGTVMARSRLPLRKWAFAIYLCATSLKGVSSMKLHRDLKVTQKTAWFLAHRIRAALESDGHLFDGPVEADETFVGGRESNKHTSQKLNAGRGPVGKTAVAGVRDRVTGTVSAAVVPDTTRATLQGFVRSHDTGRDGLHRRGYGLPGAPESRDRGTPRGRVGERPSPYERPGVVLVDAEARLSRHLPPHEPEAPPAIRR